MSRFLRNTLFLWRTYLLRTLLTKRSALVFLGCCVPPGLAWVTLSIPHLQAWPIETFLMPSYALILQLAVPLAAVLAGSAVVADEIDDRTITYLLTRPVSRPAILLGRWLAVLTILVVFVGASVLSLGAIVEHKSPNFVAPEPHEIVHPARGRRPERVEVVDPTPPKPVAEAMVDHRLPEGLLASVLTAALLGVAVYSAVFAALGALIKHPMIVGLAFAGAIEGLLANLPGTSQTWTVQYYMRSILLARYPEIWQSLPYVGMAKFDSAQEATTTLAVVLALALAIGSFAIRRRQYVLSA